MIATGLVAELVTQPLRSWVRIEVLLACPFSTVVCGVRAKKFPIVDGMTACTSLCTCALIACMVQSGGRCQPRFACLDFTDLAQSGWTASLGFNSLSLWIFGLPDTLRCQVSKVQVCEVRLTSWTTSQLATLTDC